MTIQISFPQEKVTLVHDIEFYLNKKGIIFDKSETPDFIVWTLNSHFEGTTSVQLLNYLKTNYPELMKKTQIMEE